ncbi:hypothetical protein BH10CHL1_BH10CHL1_31470 [soil metagenome]
MLDRFQVHVQSKTEPPNHVLSTLFSAPSVWCKDKIGRDRQRFFANFVRLLLALFLLSVESTPLWAIAPAMPVAAPANDIAAGCGNLVEGGDFETLNPAWEFQPSTNPPRYTTDYAFGGSVQSLVLSDALGASSDPSISEVRYRAFQLPASATRIALHFHYLPFYEDALDTDRQQAEIYYANTSAALAFTTQVFQVLNAHETSSTTSPNWRQRDADLTSLAGQWISLRFRVRNTGGPARTWMYLDNVEIEYCPPIVTPITPTFTPTMTPVGPPTATNTPVWTPTTTPFPPTATPLPPPPVGCFNIALNGGFETDSNWICGEDPVPPYYAGSQHQAGARSMKLGHPPEDGGPDRVTYSSIRQLVTIPSNVQTAELRWWHLYQTQQAADPNPSAASDRQEVILLATSGKVLKVLKRVLSNEVAWQQEAIDVTAFRGQTFYIYFNVFNDGNGARTWGYLDEVALNICYPAAIATPIPPTVDAAATANALAAQQTQVAQDAINANIATQTALAIQAATATAQASFNQTAEASAASTSIDSAATQTAEAQVVAPAFSAQQAPSITINVAPSLPVPTVVFVTVEADFDYLAATATAAANAATGRLVPPKIVSTFVSSGWITGLGTIAVLVGIVVASFLLAALWTRLSSPERLLLVCLVLIAAIWLTVRFWN